MVMNLMLIGVLSRGKGVSKMIEAEINKELLIIGAGVNIILWLAIKSERASQSLILYIFERMQHHNFLKLILDNSTDSLLILDDQLKITYSNPSFRTTFKPLIKRIISN